MQKVMEDVFLIDIPRTEYPDWRRVSTEPISCHVIVGDETVLFGTGHGSNANLLISQLEEIGGIDVVIAEHGDSDHFAAIGALVEHYDDLIFAIPKEEAAIIDKYYHNVTVDVLLKHNQEYWGFQSIKIPGHTAGNMSFLDKSRGILIVGDSFVNSESEAAAPGDWSGKFAPIDSYYSMKDDLARKNIKKLKEYDFEIALITHGDDVLENAQSELNSLISDLESM